MVPLTPYFNLTTDISTASRSVKVDSIKRKFENLAMEQTKESRRSKSLPSENTKSRNGFGSGLNAHACDANPLGLLDRQTWVARGYIPCQNTLSFVVIVTSVVSKCDFSYSKTIESAMYWYSSGAVATLRQHFISLSC